MIEEVFRNYLINDPGITSYVAQRIYPLRLPQNPTYPSITYQVISEVTTYHMTAENSIRECRIQIDIYAESYAESKTIWRTIHNVISGFRGVWDTTNIQGVFGISSQDFEEEETKIFRVSADYYITYEV